MSNKEKKNTQSSGGRVVKREAQTGKLISHEGRKGWQAEAKADSIKGKPPTGIANKPPSSEKK